jgi:hypothetical protein
MNTLALYATLASVLSSCAVAQSIQDFTPCKFSQSTSVGVSDGIEVRRVGITDNRADYGATVFLPASDKPTPGILFSYSAMKGAEGGADLLRFAYAMARAGAASIVLDGTMSWDRASDTSTDNQRSPHLLACAGQWLLICLPGEVPCWPGGTWLKFGENADHETGNTKLMLTREGQLQFAEFARRHLGLAEIQPAWLEQPVRR